MSTPTVPDLVIPRRRGPAGARLLLVLAVVAGIIATATSYVAHRDDPPPESSAAAPLTGPAPLHRLAGAPGLPAPGGDPARRTLVLFNGTGASAALGHTDAIQAANLVSHGGSWTMHPVERYVPGEMRGYQDVVYVARYSPVPLPGAFLADVIAGGTPVVWMGDNVEQLFATDPGLARRLGWRPGGVDPVDVPTVEYRGQSLLRRTGTTELMNRIDLLGSGPTSVLGTVHHADGSGYPWAVSAGDLTYIGEVPFSYVDTKDRYLAATDILTRAVTPAAPDRRRALIRIEDVGPNTNPDQIRAIADLLSSRGIPFSLATYTYYRDPHGTAHQGKSASFRMVDVPRLVDALRYARERGATILMHGYTHQFESAPNPYDGTSGADFEFYRAHVDQQNAVQLDGPVPGDSRAWAANRLAVGRAEFVRAGLPDPGIFEMPHYTGSAEDYLAVADVFGVRYDQGTYFTSQCPDGSCTDDDISSNGLFQQYFPYPVRDVYGSVVVPENLGNVAPAFNTNAARTPQDIVSAARAMTVVRDGVASAFFHPFLPLDQLATVVDGIRGQGYHFVSPQEILDDHG